MHNDLATGYWAAPVPEHLLSHANRLVEVQHATSLLLMAGGFTYIGLALLTLWIRKGYL